MSRALGRQVLLISLCWGGIAASPAILRTYPHDHQSFRSSTKVVSLYATVIHEHGRLVPDLPREAFEIRDNGRIQNITVFANETVPITVAIMLDTSGSVVRDLPVLQRGAEHFVSAMLPFDRAVVGSFGAEIAIGPTLTSDQTVLRRTLRDELWAGGPTPLWNAMDTAMGALVTETGRRVVLVFTDGINSTKGFRGPSEKSASEVAWRARAADFMVYAIRPIRTEELSRRLASNDRLLDVVRESGGGHFYVNPSDDLGTAFRRVADELHHQYVLGFTPTTLDGRVHRLDVRVKRDGMKARARTSYVAQPE